MSTHYEVLGVSPTATPLQVKAAYDKIAAAQADLLVFRLPEAVEDAFDTLSDPGRRAAYDASLLPPKAKEPPRPAAPARPVAAPRPSAPTPPPVPPRPVPPPPAARPSQTPAAASSNRYNNPPISPVAPRPSPPAAAPAVAAIKRQPVVAPNKVPAPAKSRAAGWMRWLVAIGLLWWGGSYVIGQLQSKSSASQVAFAGRVTSRNGLKLRAEPDKSAAVIDRIYYFETVAVLQSPDSSEEESQIIGTTKWYKVTHAGKTGWVLAEHIKRL